MKVIIKSYYKNSSLFKKGTFVDPISSDSSKEEIENFLKEKMIHEGLNGNYTKSELEFIDENLTETVEYMNAKKVKWKSTLIPVLITIGGIYLFYKLFSILFGWIIILTIATLIGYPILKGVGVPKSNAVIAVILIFVYFIIGGGSSEKDFIDNQYIGKYCEEGYPNKCIEFFEDGSFNGNTLLYGIDGLGNNTYFGNGTWSYNGKQDPSYSLFSDCNEILEYDDVVIKSSEDCCPIEEDLAFRPGSSFKDGRARFRRLFSDPITYVTIGCIDYVKVK